jgi:hypothetical protein
VDPHHLDADPDSNFLFDDDPDPTFLPDADPDPYFKKKRLKPFSKILK